MLKKAFTFEELNAMLQPVIDAEQGKSAPPGNIIDWKPVLEAGEEHDAAAPDAAGDPPPQNPLSRICW